MSATIEVQGRPASRRDALWSRERRMTTAGLLLLVTLVAFEALSVGTAMPTMVTALHGQALYGLACGDQFTAHRST